MPATQYIFFSCDEHKSNSSRDIKFLFSDNHYNKVLKFIEANLSDYFDGSPQRQKDSFNEVYKMVKKEGIEISKVLNTYTDIYACCEEVEMIIHIQH